MSEAENIEELRELAEKYRLLRRNLNETAVRYYKKRMENDPSYQEKLNEYARRQYETRKERNPEKYEEIKRKAREYYYRKKEERLSGNEEERKKYEKKMKDCVERARKRRNEKTLEKVL